MSNKTSKSAEMIHLQNIGESLSERLVVVGSELRKQLQAAIYDGNQYQVAIKESDGRVLVRIPLNVGLLIALPCLMFRSLRWTVVLFGALLFAQAHLSLEAPAEQPATSEPVITAASQPHRGENGTKAKAKSVKLLEE